MTRSNCALQGIQSDTHHEEARFMDALSALLKAGGDRLRLDILRVLRLGAFGVLELSRIFDMRQSAMSHHLKVLLAAGLVETQREGNQIFYRRPTTNEICPDMPGLRDVVRVLFEQIDETALPPALEARLREIHIQRAELSQAFFNKHADQFRAHQELVAGFELYAPACLGLIRQSIDQHDYRTALEIGPGTGEFLIELSSLFDYIHALDNSEAMLDQARCLVTRHGLKNVGFLLGDARLAATRNLRADVVVMNMVLHHVASPEQMFRDCAPLLNPGGMLVVTELAPHHQAWTREKCGDVWLGFAPEQLQDWARQAGLAPLDALHIGVRNGFQVQIQKFELPGHPPHSLSTESTGTKP